MTLDQWFCPACGSRNRLVWKTGYAEPLSCSACGGTPGLLYPSLVELGISSAEFRECPTCARANTFSDYCPFCGHRF